MAIACKEGCSRVFFVAALAGPNHRHSYSSTSRAQLPPLRVNLGPENFTTRCVCDHAPNRQSEGQHTRALTALVSIGLRPRCAAATSSATPRFRH